MIHEFTVGTYNTDLLSDPKGLTDAEALAVAQVVSDYWDAKGDPAQVLALIQSKLGQTFPKTSDLISFSPTYKVKSDGNGGLIVVCIPKKTINVTLNGKTIAVEFTWGVIQ